MNRALIAPRKICRRRVHIRSLRGVAVKGKAEQLTKAKARRRRRRVTGAAATEEELGCDGRLGRGVAKKRKDKIRQDKTR